MVRMTARRGRASEAPPARFRLSFVPRNPSFVPTRLSHAVVFHDR
jgi:hypothetical protein